MHKAWWLCAEAATWAGWLGSRMPGNAGDVGRVEKRLGDARHRRTGEGKVRGLKYFGLWSGSSVGSVVWGTPAAICHTATLMRRQIQAVCEIIMHGTKSGDRGDYASYLKFSGSGAASIRAPLPPLLCTPSGVRRGVGLYEAQVFTRHRSLRVTGFYEAQVLLDVLDVSGWTRPSRRRAT